MLVVFITRIFKWRLVKSRFCFLHFTVIFAGLKKIVRDIEVR